MVPMRVSDFEHSVGRKDEVNWRKAAISIAIGVGSTIVTPSTSIAADLAWTTRNRLAAETWRAVDENFLDKSL